MLNEAYRVLRSTDKPLRATEAQVQRAWNRIRKARALAAGKPWPPKERKPGPFTNRVQLHLDDDD